MREKEVGKGKHALYLFLGVVLVLYSLLAILGYMGDGSLVDASFYQTYVLEAILLMFGLFLLRISFTSTQRLVTLLVGLCVLLFGVVPLLAAGGLLRFLPITINLEPNVFLLSLLLFLSGIYLIVDQYFSLVGKRYPEGP